MPNLNVVKPVPPPQHRQTARPAERPIPFGPLRGRELQQGMMLVGFIYDDDCYEGDTAHFTFLDGSGRQLGVTPEVRKVLELDLNSRRKDAPGMLYGVQRRGARLMVTACLGVPGRGPLRR